MTLCIRAAADCHIYSIHYKKTVRTGVQNAQQAKETVFMIIKDACIVTVKILIKCY